MKVYIANDESFNNIKMQITNISSAEVLYDLKQLIYKEENPVDEEYIARLDILKELINTRINNIYEY